MQTPQLFGMTASSEPDSALEHGTLAQLRLDQCMALIPIALKREKRFHFILFLSPRMFTTQPVPKSGKPATQTFSAFARLPFFPRTLSRIHCCALGLMLRGHCLPLLLQWGQLFARLSLGLSQIGLQTRRNLCRDALEYVDGPAQGRLI